MSSMDDTKSAATGPEIGPSTGPITNRRSARCYRGDVTIDGGRRRSARRPGRHRALCGLAPQAFDAVFLVGGNLAGQRQAGVEAQIGDRGESLFVRVVFEFQPADNAGLVSAVTDPANRAGRGDLDVAPLLKSGREFWGARQAGSGNAARSLVSRRPI